MRRHAIGIITLLLLAGAAAFWIWPQSGSTWAPQFEAACWRVGALMGVLWIAYPDLKRIPPWFWGVLVAALVIVAVRPRVALAAVPVLLVLAVLRPRVGRRR